MLSEDFSQEALIEPIFSKSLSSNPLKLESKKRKKSQTKRIGITAKKVKLKTETAEIEDEIDVEAGLNNSFSKMDSQLLAEYVAQQTKTHESDLSMIELEDKYVKASSILDTSSWEKQRNLENFCGFLERFSSNVTKLWSAAKKNGAPHTIIVSSAGLRAATIARSLKNYPKNKAKVAKLFAKHIKIGDAITFLKTTQIGFATGTPKRISDLIDDGALQTDQLERIVIDASHVDSKKRGILEIKETQIALTALLGQKIFQDRFGSEKDVIKLLFY